MGAMADHFGEDREHWEAVGYLHDYDYEKYPEEHLQHTKEPLLAAGVSEEDVRAILADKSREGFTAQIRDLLQKYGAKKLSEVDPSHYKALIADVEGLSNG
jgi:predicted hydrolase (HD superfamily)